MSTIRVTNLQNASAASPAIVLAADGTATAQLSSVNGGPLSGMRNKIINGNFDFWQRGTSFTLSTSFQYTADRWRAKVGTGGAGSIVRNIGVGNQPYLTFAITTAGTGSHELSQPIEFVRSVTGTDGASTSVSVSFRLARTSGTGTVDVSLLQYFGGGGSPSASVSLSLGTITPTATATRYTLTGTLASIAGKTYGTNGDDQLVLIFTPSNAVASYDFSEIQVEAGSVATPFERRSYGQELALCQRYYEKSYDQSVVPGTSTYVGMACAVGSNVSSCGGLTWKVTKRAAPTVTLYSNDGTSGAVDKLSSGTKVTGASANNIGESSFRFVGVTTTVESHMYHYTLSAEL